MKNATDILVDISDNMEGNKQSCAKQVLLNEILPLVDFSEITGLKTFMASGPVCLVIRSVDLGVNPKSDFEQKINNLPMPNSGSPISKAILESLDELKKQTADNKRIVIVTNGIDTLQGSYISAVKEAAAQNVQVSVVLVGANDSAKSAAAEAATIGKGVACSISGDNYNAAVAHTELGALAAVLSGQAAPAPAPKVEEPKVEAPKYEAPKVEPRVEAPKAAEPAPEVKAEAPTSTVDDFKEAVAAVEEKAYEPIKIKDIQASVDAAVEETINLAEVIAKNKSSLSDIQKQAADTISQLMNSCGKAIAELQEKASAKISELVNDHNVSAANLMQKSADAFYRLSEEKAAALAKVDKLIADDKAVVINTDSELADQVELKSQQFLNSHLQKKYPGRVKWMNENGDARKGYDFVVDDNDSDNNTYEYVIICKGIIDNSKTFFMRQREWEACIKNARNYQVYVISNLQSAEPALTVIDNLMDWIVAGKVVPCADKNVKLKGGHVVLTLK